MKTRTPALPREILLIKLGALGDVVRTTGLLKPLRRLHEPCRLSWLTSREAIPLLDGLPIDRIATLGRTPPSWLKKTRFDLVICMDEDSITAKIASTVDCVKKVGVYRDDRGRLRYTPDSEPVYGMSLLARNRRRADARKFANRTSYQRLWARVLGLKGKTEDFRPLLAPKIRRPKRAHGSVVAVHAGSGARWPSKRLPIQLAAEIVRGLDRAGMSPVLVAGPGERRRNAAIVRLAGAGKIGPALPLAGFARWLAGCRALVSTDSLPMHLAMAAGVPCVALFGPTSMTEIETFGRAVKIAPSEPCRCFYRPACDGASCLGLIDPREVVARTLELSA